jgi:hypothetical protein
MGGGIGLPSAMRALKCGWGGIGGGIGLPSTTRAGATMVWLPAELLTELTVGSTIKKAASDNTTTATKFLFTDGLLLRPTVRGHTVNGDLR